MRIQKYFPLVVVVAGVLAYQNSFTGSYVNDDFGSILENRTIRRLWPIWQCLSPPHRNWLTVEGRPLINLSLAINYALGGFNVWGYHVLNLTVHILAGLTLLGIMRRTLLQPALRDRFGTAANELALATAVLWTVHPLQSESVTYIIQRAESMMGLFYLLTLYGFIRGAESQQPKLWYGLSVIACVLGMASKEVMATAPLMVLLYDRAFVSGSLREAWRQRRSLYLALASTWLVLGFLLVSAGIFAQASTHARNSGVRWWEYLATQPGVILYYLRLSVWPSPLTMHHQWPIARTWMRILPSTVMILILLGASARAWRKDPAWGFAGAWFFLILAPSSSFVAALDPIYEHRMYLSLAAVVSVVALGLYSMLGRLSWAVVVAAAIGLGILTWRQNRCYQRDPHFSLGLAYGRAGKPQEAFAEYEQALRTTPHDIWLHYNLGFSLLALGRPHEAIEHFEQAGPLKPDLEVTLGRFEQALRLKPEDAEVHYSLAVVFERMGKVEDAIRHYQEAVRIRPDGAEAHNALGRIQLNAGDVRDAILQFEQALRLKPDDAEAHNNLGGALWNTGNGQDAIAHFEQALRLRPDSADAHYNLGAVLLKLGKVAEAVEQLEQALRLEPNDAEAHNNLGIALVKLGRVPEAIAQYEQALRIKPDYAEAHYNWGVALARLDQGPKAIEAYDHALQLKPDYAEAHNGFGLALAKLGRIQEGVGHWEQALRIKPDYAEAHYNWGVALAQLNKWTEAIGHWEEAVRIKPDYADAHNNLGGVFLRLGRTQDAIAQLESALRTAPNTVEAHYNLGVALEQTGKTEDAIRHYEQALRIRPDYAEAQNSLARLRAAQ